MRFSVAPMMDWTDRHCRFFHRLLTRRARLYTEMLTSGAVLHGDRARLLGFSAEEQPVALQLGGSDPAELAAAARIGAEFGYAEINLNCGCPSDRVQNGRFGACLMREPALVGACVAAMKAAVAVPVTVKCRLGVDDQAPEEALFRMAETCVAAGVDALVVHARKAWLQGLSPRENRDIPPLDYTLVRRLKAAWPALPVVINGGIADLDQARALLAPDGDLPGLDGVMLGRAAYQNPGLLLEVDPLIFGVPAPVSDAAAALAALKPYLEGVVAQGVSPHAVTRHVLGLFQGRPGARAFRRHLSTEAVKPGAGADVLNAALALLDRRSPLAA
ncbi:MAG: tRNA dihydrouridine(20/20a) synthase DusA [Hyphomicrobiales bacterium]|nr:tRNA dihydrouridine(20/20a) synthase DusA [Hyphomicrobiales bacterium]